MSEHDHQALPAASPEAERTFLEHNLTERERDAARSVLAGMTAGAAAVAMGVGASTVGSYRQRAYHKLGVRDARELAERFGSPAREPLDPEAARDLLSARGLSGTQAGVLALVAAGRSTAEVAHELCLAEGTVSAARSQGYRLLGVHSREGLVALLEAAGDGGRPEPGHETEAAQAPAPAGPRQRRAVAVLVAAALVVGAAPAAGAWLTWRKTPSLPTGLSPDGTRADASLASFTAVAADGTVLFGMNERGQFFGTRAFSTEYLAGRLDLMACLGTGGERGYCYADDIVEGHLPGQDPELALYESDGVTQIGTFAAVDADIDGTHDAKTAPFTAYSTTGAELFGRNESGQLFSDLRFNNLYLRGEADLAAVQGRGGAYGYVSRSEMERAGFKHLPEVPVYASDGTTVIDTFVLTYE